MKLSSPNQSIIRPPAGSLKKVGTVVRYLDHNAYAGFLRKNDALNKDLAKELGMLKR